VHDERDELLLTLVDAAKKSGARRRAIVGYSDAAATTHRVERREAEPMDVLRDQAGRDQAENCCRPRRPGARWLARLGRGRVAGARRSEPGREWPSYLDTPRVFQGQRTGKWFIDAHCMDGEVRLLPMPRHGLSAYDQYQVGAHLLLDLLAVVSDHETGLLWKSGLAGVRDALDASRASDPRREPPAAP